MDLAVYARASYRQPHPGQWEALLEQGTGALPFLDGAVRRLLEEYPDTNSGLSRTEQNCLEIIESGRMSPARLFGQYQQTEERKIMGDLSFWHVLSGLVNGSPPLVRVPDDDRIIKPSDRDQLLSLTDEGRAVLAGE